VAPSFSILDQYTQLSQVFDQYRILMAEVWLTPHTSADISLGQGQWFSVLDFDDSTNLTSVAAAQDYQNCLSSPQTCGHYRKFQPHVANALYAPSAFSSFGNVASPWIDAASGTVAHYGVKFAATPSTVAVQIFDLTIKLLVELRAVR
jgi:hypothetical protein